MKIIPDETGLPQLYLTNKDTYKDGEAHYPNRDIYWIWHNGKKYWIEVSDWGQKDRVYTGNEFFEEIELTGEDAETILNFFHDPKTPSLKDFFEKRDASRKEYYENELRKKKAVITVPIECHPDIKWYEDILHPITWDLKSYYKSIWIFMTILITWYYDEDWNKTSPITSPIKEFHISWRPGGG